MSKPLPLQNQFSGMKQDSPRSRMLPGSVWNMQDIIPDYGAPARERGGWLHHSNDIAAITAASATYVRGGIFATFSPTAGADPTNLCVDEDGKLFEVASNGTVTLIGTAVTIGQNPVFHGGTAVSAATAVYTGLVIIPDATGAAVPKKYDGTTLSNLGGSPPMAKYAAVYKDFTVLGNGTVGTTYHPNRVWFSPPGDPDVAVSGAVTAWDTLDSWIDFSLPIAGFASTKSALLVFHESQVSRVIGSTPPPDEDMVVDDPFQRVGLLDAFSITEDQDQVYWCAPEGVFRSDGVSLDDLTLKGGMLRYWLNLVSASTSTWTFATGIIRGRLLICVMDGTTFKDAFIIDLASYSWGRLTNLDAISFWDGLLGKADEEFFGRRGAARVGRLDTMFDVANATYKNDGDGDAVTSVLETPFYELGRPGLKVVKSLFIGYELTDHATDNPTIAVSYIKTPEETSYTAMGTLAENTTYERKRLTIGGRAPGIAFKLVRTNAGDLLGYDIGAEVGFLEESKR